MPSLIYDPSAYRHAKRADPIAWSVPDVQVSTDGPVGHNPSGRGNSRTTTPSLKGHHMDDMTDNPYYQSAYAAGCDARDNGMLLAKAMEIAETYGCRSYAYMAGWRDAGKVGV